MPNVKHWTFKQTETNKFNCNSFFFSFFLFSSLSDYTSPLPKLFFLLCLGQLGISSALLWYHNKEDLWNVVNIKLNFDIITQCDSVLWPPMKGCQPNSCFYSKTAWTDILVFTKEKKKKIFNQITSVSFFHC